ncbi:MAG: 6-pyruvoyl-tetrahydropterin synthase-related protein [Caldilineaceae bacterium]
MILHKRSLIFLVSLLLLVGALLFPFAQAGVAGSDDILITIYRVFALLQSWDVGIYYPRIAPVLAYGYGAPLFQFYPPLASYLAALFTLFGIGVVDAVKLTFALSLWFGGIGAYLYAKEWFENEASGWLAAVAFVAAPYQLANIYIRGASAEALGLALCPWILWTLHRLYASQQPTRWLLWHSLSWTALLLSHNALALFFLPIVLLFSLIESWQQRTLRRLGWSLLSLVLALGISVFFWLPALLEKDQVNITAMSSGFYDPLNHLGPLSQVVQQSLGFEYIRPAVYSFGWLPLVLGLLAGVVMLWCSRQRALWTGGILVLLIVTVVLQLPAAATFWSELPLVRFIQFPWRLFAFSTLAVSLLVAGGLSVVRTQRKLDWLLVSGISLLLFGYTFLNVPANYASELERGHFSNNDVSLRDLYERGRLGLELFSDYQPLTTRVSMTELPNSPATSSQLGNPSTTLPSITLQRYRGLTLQAQIQSEQPGQLLFNRLFLPGWKATVNDRAAPVAPFSALGISSLELPAGSVEVVVQWGQTEVRRWADRLAALAAAVWVGLFLLGQGRRWKLAATGAVVVLVLLLFWVETPASASWIRQPTVQPVQAQVGDFADLLGYSLDRPVYQAGDTINLTLFWRCRQAVSTEYKVFVHLRSRDDTQMAGQHDGAPVSGFTPTTRWLPGEILDDTHPIALDPSLAAGTYQLAVGMYDPNTVTNLPVKATNVLSGERIVLGTVEVKAK